MAVSEDLRIAALGAGDVDGAMALSTEAGWNQTSEDWLHFFRRGRTIGVRNAEGRLVASAAALPYDGSFGFIGMVLVTQDWRRRNIATQLVDQCIGHLDGLGLIPALDATAAGEEVYRRQGFVAQFRFDRWDGSGKAESDQPVRELQNEMTPARMAALDAQAFGAARPRLIEDFLGRQGTRAFPDASGDAFALVRRGRRALQAGPVVAGDESTALRLVQSLCGSLSGAMFIDVPQHWRRIGQWLGMQGFVIQRSFARMALRHKEPFGDPGRLFAVAGPEFG